MLYSAYRLIAEFPTFYQKDMNLATVVMLINCKKNLKSDFKLQVLQHIQRSNVGNKMKQFHFWRK